MEQRSSQIQTFYLPPWRTLTYQEVGRFGPLAKLGRLKSTAEKFLVSGRSYFLPTGTLQFSMLPLFRFNSKTSSTSSSHYYQLKHFFIDFTAKLKRVLTRLVYSGQTHGRPQIFQGDGRNFRGGSKTYYLPKKTIFINKVSKYTVLAPTPTPCRRS